MRRLILFVVSLTLASAALGQQNSNSMSQSSQSSSDSTSSTTTTSSGFDTSSTGDPPENQGSAEMTEWIRSNSGSKSSSRNSGFSVGFGRDNDENDDDQPSWSKSHASRPKPEQIDGTYRVSAKSGPFLCTVRLTASAYFDGYFAVTSTGCPDLWQVKRWDFDGPSIVLTSSIGDVYATFWPRGGDVWVGRSASGQRLSLSR
ncbi:MULTISPECIES: AprI/Inh family metalloprotease inhibitor [unclassified Lysobacter]|uniref:AprI/Inh family metalloprotease inhibitor n=1 Tax=unclassified Lysobacter TaxID=2635362 RepID=UPI001BE84C51|nr:MULTISPECIES: AprI/Inh family metalloprotease inhibitor [unclassified Lysobacter]MBT2750056.1 AprI/Inh family metalloprotease inhibitor [Lysobacter sp. ISL-50]MBT2775372.1 AprI/Inh family metalloprotease inhibitor [Lysobacter sp. ISL-54]MBT2783495.1 AprI/Inh family metalloprotease inhibitor [Lysobacter sp. ISL-52]